MNLASAIFLKRMRLRKILKLPSTALFGMLFATIFLEKCKISALTKHVARFLEKPADQVNFFAMMDCRSVTQSKRCQNRIVCEL